MKPVTAIGTASSTKSPTGTGRYRCPVFVAVPPTHDHGAHDDNQVRHDQVVSKSVRIIQLPPETLAALADGDLETANRTAGIPLTPYFVQPDQRGTWRRRADQVAQDPADADWITGVIWDVKAEQAVGRAGFHAPPDGDGMVEVGYSVDPAFRRRGYARAALEAMLARAEQDPLVRVVRASVRPDNTPSSTLILQYGFVQVGDQWDEEDGLELVYEVAV